MNCFKLLLYLISILDLYQEDYLYSPFDLAIFHKPFQ
jgi:hypothetical protein